MVMGFEGLRTAVITGAGSGIGRATAREFLDAGWQVVLAGRREEALQETADGDARALVVPADVTQPGDVDRLFREAADRFGRVDVLFNNAGSFGPSGSVDQISLADWNETVAVNLTGTMLCAAAAVRQMKAQDPPGGRIINNGSLSAIAPRPLAAAYTATKHAVTGLTKSIDLDGRAYGISCAQIDIGNAATELLAGITTGGALQPDGSRKVEPTFPAEEAARTVLFMAELPASANPGSVVLTAAGMPFLGRG
ncbi:short-chain dehydrogenase [Arthrobacter sp. Edens01]|nr:short-chain dehydrogenase [Arthrobacter sp. Edens01]